MLNDSTFGEGDEFIIYDYRFEDQTLTKFYYNQAEQAIQESFYQGEGVPDMTDDTDPWTEDLPEPYDSHVYDLMTGGD